MSGSLSEFLVSAKQGLRQALDNKEKVTLVIGNENADIDSVVAAILFAYKRSASPPSNAFTKLYIPVAQLSTSDVSSNEQLSRLLSECSLQPSELITLDDIISSGEAQSGLIADNTRMFLVNQNKLVGRMGEDYSKNVIGCIDNHGEEDYVPKDVETEPRIVGKAATTTSLVVNHARGVSGSEEQIWDPAAARLALGAILVNTEDMQGSSKTTEEDKNAVEYLLRSVTSAGQFDRASFYNGLVGGRQPTATTGAQEQVPFDAHDPVRGEPVDTPMTQPPNTAVFEQDPTMAGGQPVDTTMREPRGDNIATESRDTAMGGSSLLGSSYSFSQEQVPIILANNFKPFSETGGNIGISTSQFSIKDLIIQAERDLAAKSINETVQPGSTSLPQEPTVQSTEADPYVGIGNTTGGEIRPGSPFTASIREFAKKQGVDIFGLLTNSAIGNEAFFWILDRRFSATMPKFLDNFSQPLGLGVWEGQNDEIVKEAGMSDGLMRVYWVGAKDVTADVVAGMLGQSASS